MLEEVDGVRPDAGCRHGAVRQPRVPAVDVASLEADVDEVGQPVAGRLGEPVLARDVVGHEIEQLLAVLHVAVEAPGAGVQLGSHPPHRHGVEALAVGDVHRGTA